MASTQGLTVSLIVPVHRDSASFRQALAAICALEPPADEVVVAVDGPVDDLAALALSHGARVVELHQQRGPAIARNSAARAARCDVLLFVDADVVVPPDSVGRVRDYLTSHPEISAIIGTYDDEPADPGFFSQYKNLLNHHVHQTANAEGSTFWGAFGAVRRSTFVALGGFDRRYPRPTIEDIELGYRIKERGERIHVVKDLQVKHLKRWTARRVLRTDVRDRALPWSALIVRTGQLPNDLNVSTRGRVSVALAAVALTGLVAARSSPRAARVIPFALTGMVALDWPLLRFLADRRGWDFAARSMCWHVLYHLYSGGSFAVAVGHQLAGTPVWRYRRHRDRAARRAGRYAPVLDISVGTDVPEHLIAAVRRVDLGREHVVEFDPPRQAAPMPCTACAASWSLPRHGAVVGALSTTRRARSLRYPTTIASWDTATNPLTGTARRSGKARNGLVNIPR